MTDATPPPAANHTRSASGYLLLGVLASLMPGPYHLVAIAPLAAAVVEHVRALRALRGSALPRSARTWSAVGLGICAMLLGSLVMPYASVSSRDYRDCLDGANTQLARQSCEQEYG